MSARRILVDTAHAGQRVDEALADLVGSSIQAAKRLCVDGHVQRGGLRLKKGERVRDGDVLEVLVPERASAPVPELPLIAATPRFVVVDKPAGLPTHRLRPLDPPAALDAVLARWPAAATAGPDPREGGLLHRLDVGTSGALAVALQPRAFEEGRAAFKEGRARKLYLALVHGALAADGALDAPVAHDPGDARRSVVVDTQDARHRGKPRQAITRWHTLVRREVDALLLLDGLGGRRHQVRVHMAHLGVPLWGDDLYGGPAWRGPALPSHALHATWLRFEAAGDLVVATARAPAAFRAVVEEVLGTHALDAMDAVETDPAAAFPA